MQAFFHHLEKKRSKRDTGPATEKFVSEMSLSNFTSQFLYYVVRESLQLLKKNYTDNDYLEDVNGEAPVNKITLLIDLLTIIEVDRVLQIDLNAVMVLELK